MTSSPPSPPLGLRLAAAALRRLPRVRGRGRLETSLHRALQGRGWRDVVRVHGTRSEVALDDLVGRTLYLNGVFEPEGTLVVRELVSPGVIVFDVGAHTGYYTLLFSSLTGASGGVHAFEPVPETAARLRTSLASAPHSTMVQIHEIALSDRDEELTMNVSGVSNTGASHVVAAEVDDRGRRAAGVARTITVRGRPGDAIWSEAGKPPVALVKIDVEGHEIHVLRGLEELLASERCVVLTEVRDRFLRGAGGTREGLFALMRGQGFVCYDFVPGERRFVENPVPRDGELIVFSGRPL